jgi:nitrile hydratase
MAMDGIHDMGGMHGFGRVEAEAGEPVFHADWEGRVFALVSAVPFAALFGDDQFRPAIERIAPERYLRESYYAKWLEALTSLLVEHGWITPAELSHPDDVPIGGRHARAIRPDAVVPAIFAGASQAQPEASAAARFRPGDAVACGTYAAAALCPRQTRPHCLRARRVPRRRQAQRRRPDAGDALHGRVRCARPLGR